MPGCLAGTLALTMASFGGCGSHLGCPALGSVTTNSYTIGSPGSAFTTVSVNAQRGDIGTAAGVRHHRHGAQRHPQRRHASRLLTATATQSWSRRR